MTRLIADIGGTNARFALVEPDGAVRDERYLLVRDYPDLAAAAEAYLGANRVSEAVIAVATPVETDEIGFTNSPWRFSISGLKARLGVRDLAVINDFVAQALAMPQLARSELEQMGGGTAAPGRAVGVLGAGTGLGVSALVPGKIGWTALPTEGGHVSFAPGNEREDQVLTVMRARLGHVSNERLLSGQGLLNLAQSLAVIEGRTTAGGHGRGGDRSRSRRQLPRLRRGRGHVQRAAGCRCRRPRAHGGRARRRLCRRRRLPSAGHLVRPRRLPPPLPRQGPDARLPRADPDLARPARRHRPDRGGALPAGRLSPGPELPDSPFWRFSLQFYARPGVADACLALQDREGVDVNLILLGLWLGGSGHRLSGVAGRRLAKLARAWQQPIVAPLRRVRQRLKQRADLPWAESVAGWRRRLGELELAMEQVEQLLLEEAVGPIAAGSADEDAMRANLAALGFGRLLETGEIAQLLRDGRDYRPVIDPQPI